MKVVDRDTAAQTKHPCFVFAHSYILVRVLLDVEGKPKKYHNMFKGPSPHPSHPPLIFFVPYIWVLLKPPALSGCPLAAYVSATAASSANVSSGNKQPSQRPSATPHLRQHHGRLSIQRTSNPEHLLYYMMKQLCRLTIRKLIIYLFTFSSACYKPALFQQLKMM